MNDTPEIDPKEARRQKRKAEKKALAGTPIPKKPPRAMLVINISTIHPYDPNDPESRVEFGKCDPLSFEIYDDKSLTALPPNCISYLRALLQATVQHCRTYTPVKPVETPEQLISRELAQKNEVLTGPPPEANAANIIAAGSAPTEPPMQFHTHLEDEEICARCGWVESQCGCVEGFLAPEAP